MAIDVTITGDQELVAKLHDMTRLREGLRDAVVECQYRLQNVIKRLLSGEVLHVRTGHLRDSVTVNPLEESSDGITGTVGVNEPYARILARGGTIVPRRAKALTIPMEAVLTASGVARYTAREIFDMPSIGGFTNIFIAKGMIFGRNGNTITPLFALKQSVTIPARPYDEMALNEVSDFVQARLSQAIEEFAAA